MASPSQRSQGSMKSASSRREAKSPSDGSLPYQPGIVATSLASFMNVPKRRWPSQRSGATELLDLAQAEWVEDAARRDLEPGPPAIEIHRDREALGLRRRLHVEPVEQTKKRPRPVEGERRRAGRAAQLDLRSDARARPLNRHRRGVAGDELDERAVDVERDLLETVFHFEGPHVDLERRCLACLLYT